MNNILKKILPVIMGSSSILLMVWQYFYNRSLWIDEAKLAVNIIDKSFIELTQPLTSTQITPIFFLWIQKGMTCIFGEGEMAFRLFPLICAIAVVLLAFKVFLKLTNDYKVALIAYSLIVFNYWFLFYSSELKQYSTDLLVTFTLLYFYLKKYSSRNIKSVTLLIVGSVLIWISYVTVLLLFVIGTVWFVEIFKRSKKLPLNVVAVIGVWLFVFGCYYMLFLSGHPMRSADSNNMAFWRHAFLPQEYSINAYFQWLRNRYDMIFGNLLFFPNKFGVYHVFGLFYVGSVLMLVFKKKWKLLFLLTGPVLLHFVLSCLRIYPLELRVMFYLVPLFLVTIAFGMISSVKFFSNRFSNPKLCSLAIAILLLPSLQMLRQVSQVFPIEKEEFKKSWAYMLENLESSDLIYIYNAARDPYEYYSRIGYVDVPNEIILGAFHRDDFSQHVPNLNKIKGRVWVIITHDYKPHDSRFSSMSEGDYILNILSSGGEVMKRAEFVRSKAVLIRTP